MPTSVPTPSARARFACRLKALRGPRGFATARSFAKALDIDENRYTRYERAEVEPDLSLIVKICALLAVSPNDLLDCPAASEQAMGFSEGSTPAPHPPGAAEGSNGSISPRRALAWQLAEELAAVDAPPEVHQLQTLARVSKLFNEIDADTFGFVAHMSTDARLANLDNPSARRIGQLAAELINTLNAEILGASHHR